jgi:ribosomal protein L11 methyltransferase
VSIDRQSPSPQPAAAGDQPATVGGLGPGWLRAIASANKRMPSRLAAGFACLLMALMILLELRSAEGVPAFPVYYLLAVSLLAWFAGVRLAVLAVTVAFAVTFASAVMGGTLTTGSAIVFLPRLLTFAAAAAIARGLSNTRALLDFIYQNPGFRSLKGPHRVGARLLVVPIPASGVPPENVEIDPGVVPLYIQTGMAFGSASHSTTRMCLVLLEQYIRTGAAVLDVGCGTGILSIAAVKLGAAHVHAIDISPRAIQTAGVNLAHNGVSDRVTLLQGSLDVVKSEVLPGSFDKGDASGSAATSSTDNRFDVITANLYTPVVKELLKTGLPELLRSAGILIASGIQSSDMNAVQEAMLAAGLRLEASVEERGWCALAARRP